MLLNWERCAVVFAFVCYRYRGRDEFNVRDRWPLHDRGGKQQCPCETLLFEHIFAATPAGFIAPNMEIGRS
jgi:hypothetical protein